jgi:hypothetical protein
MKLKKGMVIVTVLLALSLALSSTAALAAGQELVVVANKPTFQAAQKWVDFLTTKGLTVKHVEPSQFGANKGAPYMVVMGGVAEPGGISDLIKEAVGAQDFAALAKPGAGKMFVRSNVWGQGQNVLVFAGSDPEAAAKARADAREEWMGMLADWFGLELGGPSLHGY